MSEDKVIKEIKKEELKFIKESRKNPWMPASIVLAIILIVVIAVNSFGGASRSTATENLLGFIEEQTGESASLVSVNDSGSFYEIIVQFQGEDVPVYVTKDGKYLVSQPILLESSTIKSDVDASASQNAQQAQAQTTVPKTDKPVADFYVFTYCPYGTQMEKALVPVYNILKSKADINIVFIGAMHGEYERVESLRQICIQKNYGKDKLFAYLDKFNTNSAVGSCGGKDACVVPLIETIYTQLSIDKTKINTCMSSDAPALYDADVAKSRANGISGSPSVIINGVKASVGRSPSLVQQAVCSAFNTAPSECSQTLSTTQASAGFGSSAGSGSSAATC